MDPYARGDEKTSAELYDDRDDSDGIIEGRNAVIEALRAGRPIDKIFIAKGECCVVSNSLKIFSRP